MSPATEARIYLADHRGCTQSDTYRSLHVFNYGKYFNQYRQGFEQLMVLNDETLKENERITYLPKEPYRVLLLPVVGALHCKIAERELTADAGQTVLFSTRSDRYEIINPYKTEAINYLHFCFKDSEQKDDQLWEFNLDEKKNSLVQINAASTDQPSIFIGKYDGRQEGVLKIDEPSSGVFVFIIEGAFEVQNRLLHSRDGLALRNPGDVEFEALSNEAIILLIKMRLTSL